MKIKRKQLIAYKLMIIALPLLSILGIYLLILTGKNCTYVKNVFLDNLFWAPIEILATTFIIGAIIKKSEERIHIQREQAEYFSIAKNRQDTLIRNIKERIIETYTGSFSTVDLDKQISEIKENIDKYINNDKLKSGYKKPTIDINNLESLFKILSFQQDPNYKMISIFEASGGAGGSIHEQIKEFYEIYLRFIPSDIFIELDAIYQTIYNDVLFSPNKNYIVARQFLTNRTLKDEELKNMVEEYQKFFIKFIDHIDKIEQITKEHYKDLN